MTWETRDDGSSRGIMGEVVQLLRRADGTANPDSFAGSPLDDDVNGLGGNDTLQGGAGDDALNGGTGQDGLFGNTGDDLLNAARVTTTSLAETVETCCWAEPEAIAWREARDSTFWMAVLATISMFSPILPKVMIWQRIPAMASTRC